MSAADRLAEIEARVEAATEGPWRVAAEGSEGSRFAPDYGTLREQSRFIGICNGRVQPEDGRNAAFIAAARTDLPATTAALRAVLSVADDWNERGGPGSRVEREFGEQVISIGHIHARITAAVTTALDGAS